MRSELATIDRPGAVVHRPAGEITRPKRPLLLAALFGTGRQVEHVGVQVEPGRVLTDKQMRRHVRDCHNEHHEKKLWCCCRGIGCEHDPLLRGRRPAPVVAARERVTLTRAPRVLVGEVIEDYSVEPAELARRSTARRALDPFGIHDDAD